MLVATVVAGLILFSLFLAMLTQSPREEAEDVVPAPAVNRQRSI
jgi:hypothetical protein